MVDVGHAIDHTGIVLPEYGGNAFSRKFLQESLTGGLSLQGGSDSFLRLYGYGMSGNSLFAFHKFLLECLVAYAFTDLAGFDGYAGPFSFFIGSRIDQSMIGLSLYRLVGLFHRYMEKAKQGFKLLDGLELVSLHDGLDHIGYLMLDIPLPVIDGSQRQGFPSLHLLGGVTDGISSPAPGKQRSSVAILCNL